MQLISLAKLFQRSLSVLSEDQRFPLFQMSWASLKAQNSQLAAAEEAKRKTRWAEVIKSFPTVESLRTRAEGERSD